MVRIGYARVGFALHVYFMFFVSISFALGTQHELVFWWNMGLSMYTYNVLINMDGLV